MKKITMSTIVMLSIVAIGILLIQSSSRAQQGSVGSNNGDLQIGAVTFKFLTAVSYSGITSTIWADSENNSKPVSEWKFGFEPMFIPRTKADGKPEIDIHPFNPNLKDDSDLWSASLTVVTLPNAARDLAVKKIANVLSGKFNTLEEVQLFSLDLGQLVFRIPDLAVAYPKCWLGKDASLSGVSAQFYQVNGLTSETYDIVITCPSRQIATNASSFAITKNVEYNYTFKGHTALTNSTRISLKNIKNTNFYVQLFGSGSGIKPDASGNVYVHRDDIRSLSESIQTAISADYVIEDPATFTDSVAEDFIKSYANNKFDTQSAEYDKNKLAATYNKDDLSPDVITKQTNKVFSEIKGTSNYTTTSDDSLNIGVPVEGVVATFGFGSKVSRGAIIETYAKHDIDLSWEGQRFVAKKIRVRQINRSSFESSATFITAKTVLSPKDYFAKTKTLQLSQFNQQGNTGSPSFGQRLATLETAEKSMSRSVIAFRLDGECPDGWNEFTEAAGRVIVGVGAGAGLTPRGLMQSGGEERHVLTVPNLPPHSHSETLSGGAGAGAGYLQTPNQSWGTNSPGVGSHMTGSTGDGKPFESMPPWIALRYCVKR